MDDDFISKYHNNMSETILITGGTGFAGSHLVDSLLEKNEQNIHVTTYGKNTSYVADLLPSDQIHQLDITNLENTSGLLKKLQPKQIYHLASIAGVGGTFKQINQVLQINTQIQLSLLSAITEACPKTRLLTIGSALEYKPSLQPLKETDQLGPNNPYGVSKINQEMLSLMFHQQHQLDLVMTRSFNHYGPRQALGFVVADFAKQIAANPKSIQVGNLSPIRDFTYAADVASAYITLMEKGETGEIYNVGSGVGYSIESILTELIKISGKEIQIEINKERYRPVDVSKVVANIDKIRSLDWQPKIELIEGLQKTFNYYQRSL